MRLMRLQKEAVTGSMISRRGLILAHRLGSRQRHKGEGADLVGRRWTVEGRYWPSQMLGQQEEAWPPGHKEGSLEAGRLEAGQGCLPAGQPLWSAWARAVFFSR